MEDRLWALAVLLAALSVTEEAAPRDLERFGPVDEEDEEGDVGTPMQDRLGLHGESSPPSGALNPWTMEDPEDEAGDVATPSQDRLLPRYTDCLLYTSPSPRDATLSRMPSSA